MENRFGEFSVAVQPELKKGARRWCSPGAAEHPGPGCRPKGTEQSIQEAFHQGTRNNCRG